MAWPAVPEELLSGPRGRQLCFQIVSPYDADGRLRQCPGWRDLRFAAGAPGIAQLADELTALVAAADLDAVASAAGVAGLLQYVGEAANWATYWQPPYEWLQPLMTDVMGRALEPVARAVTAAPATHWWSGPLDRSRQQYTQFLSAEEGMSFKSPEPAGAAGKLATWREKTVANERQSARLPSEPAANYSGWWWSAPALSDLVMTTRSVPGLGALQLRLVEDSLGWTEALCWPMSFRADARIYEIRAPEDWTNLVSQYPLEVTRSRWHDWYKVTGRAGTWLIPDYSAVATDYDALHLTIGGYLTTAGRSLAVSVRTATMLAGWDPDKTYWLAEVLGLAGAPARWVESDKESLGWAAT